MKQPTYFEALREIKRLKEKMNQPLHEWRASLQAGYEREIAELKALVEEARPFVEAQAAWLGGIPNRVAPMNDWLARADKLVPGKET